MKKLLPSLVLLLLPTIPPAIAQESADEDLAAQGIFVESVDVNVVNVEVYVTDKKGNRVTGLTRDDFALEVANRPLAITNFYAVEGGRATAGGVESPGPESAAVDPQDEAPRVPEEQRLHLIVYVDNLNLHPFTRNRVLRQARGFLRTRLRPGDEVMLVTYERSMHTRVPFTRDPEIIASALYDVEEMSGHAVSFDSDRRDIIEAIYEADSPYEVRGRATQYAESIYNDMSFTLDALKALVESLSGLPGRKAILHVSDGLSMRAGEDVFHAIYDRFPEDSSVLMDGHRYDLSRRFQSLTNQANASRVTFYTLEAAGLRTYSYLNVSNRTPGGGPRIDQVHFSNLQSTLRFMARETGGMAFVNTNNYVPMLERMADDFDTYYSLGFSPAAAESGRFRRIHVTVKGRKGLEVRHREGYRDRSISTRMTDSTLAALHYGYQDNTLAVELDFGEMIAHGGGKSQFVVPLLVRIPLGRLSFVPQADMHRGRIRLFVGAKDSEGGMAPVQELPVPIDIPGAELEQAMEQYYQYEVKLIMRGGRQVVAVGVRDEIGAVTGFVSRGILVGDAGGLMARRRDSWLEMARTLGEAFVAVVAAELAVVRETAKAWGKSWGIALAIAALLLFGLFWSLGLVAVAVVHGLMAWRGLALWQAALLTAGAVLLLVAIAAAAIYFLARRYESPVAATRRRLDDHIGWWHERIVPEAPPLSEGESREAHEQGDEASSGPASEPPARS